MKRRTGRNLANSLTSLIHGYLEKMSDADLRLMRRFLRDASDSNCGWDVYALRRGLDEMVKTHQESRRIARLEQEAARLKGESRG